MRKLFTALAMAAAVLLAADPPAHAYLDGGAGSMLIQVLLAGLGGLAVMARVFLRRIFRRKPPPGKADPD